LGWIAATPSGQIYLLFFLFLFLFLFFFFPPEKSPEVAAGGGKWRRPSLEVGGDYLLIA
jgi:hypothetical protein